MTDKAIRAAKLTAAGILDKARARTAVTRAGGQIAPSKYLPNVPRQFHADGGRAGYMDGGAITVQSKDGSGIFGEGAMIHRYVHPETGSHIEVLERRNGPASVLGLEVPEEHRGKGIGQMLQAEAMERHPALMGQVSSKAAATTAYRLGRRPYSAPDASLDDVFSAIDRDSSVNMLSPQAQPKAAGGRIHANKGGSMGARADFLAGNHPEVPNVVYHGSTADFNEFRPLSHFGTMQAAHDRFKSSPKQQTNQNVIPAHISLKNPLDVGLEDDWQDNRDTIRQAADVMLNSKNTDRYYMMAAEKLQNLAYDPRWREHQLPLERQAAQILRAAGHDGIIYNNSVEDPGSRSFITLHPSQVKSAIGNQGTFDPNEPDMTKAEGGSVGDNENFQNWFGNSVTHTNGEPHVFYTGTSKDKDFTSHNVGRHGAWFVRDPAVASSYAEENDSQGYKRDGWDMVKTNTASRVIPAYVKAENPYTGELPEEYLRDNYKAAQSDWFDTLRAKGHDAWMPASQNGNLVVALKEPQQIKSIFNNGKFDPKQKHMNKAEGGEVEDNKPVDMGVARALRRFNQDSSGPPPEVEGIFNRLAAAKDAAQEAHEAAHNAGAFDNVQIGDVYKYKPLDSYAPMKVVGHGMVHVSRWGGTNPPKYVYKDHYPVAQVEYQDAAKERRNTAIELLEDRDRYDFISGRPRAVRKRGGMVDAALTATRRFTKNGKAATMALKPKGK